MLFHRRIAPSFSVIAAHVEPGRNAIAHGCLKSPATVVVNGTPALAARVAWPCCALGWPHAGTAIVTSAACQNQRCIRWALPVVCFKPFHFRNFTPAISTNPFCRDRGAASYGNPD